MRSNLRILVAAAAALLVAPVAMAENVDDQLKQMNERMQALENQLQATQDQLDASQDQVSQQADVMQKAGIARKAESGLSSFVNSIEVSGWLAGSWFWNFNDPNETALANQNVSNWAFGSINGGQNGLFYPFHPDHNSFSVDQLWFAIEKPVTEESRAGFHADMVYGRTASVLSGSSAWHRGCSGTGVDADIDDSNLDVDFDGCTGDNASDFNLYQAYIQYLTPWGPTVKAGKFQTWLGAESVQTTANFNITRGNLWTLLQPVNHYGVSVDGDTNGIIYGLAVVNDASGIDPDNNNAKHIMAKLGYGTEMYSAVGSLLYGATDPGDSTGNEGVFDLLLRADPTESFSGYLNFDYAFSGSGTTPNAWGVALAGRYGFTDRLGFALRGEYLETNNDPNVWFGRYAPGPRRDTDIWGITGTLDYLITDNLTIKAEARYDYVNNPQNGSGTANQFPRSVDNVVFNDDIDSSSMFTRRSQVITGLELTYEF